MAISAYDPSGRLRKHALLGTSFAVDPERKKEREQFKTLYGEAKLGAGKGREFMRGRLESQAKAFEQEQASRLAQLAGEKAGFEEQYSQLNDPELEKRFQEYQQFMTGPSASDTGKFIDYNYLIKGPQGIPEEVLTEASKSWYAMSPKERSEWSQTHAHPGKKLPGKLDFWTAKKWNKRRPWVVGQLAQNIWANKYGAQSQQAYQQKLTKAQEKINTAYMALQEEEAGRQQRLADRIDFYNMFLGG